MELTQHVLTMDLVKDNTPGKLFVSIDAKKSKWGFANKAITK